MRTNFSTLLGRMSFRRIGGYKDSGVFFAPGLLLLILGLGIVIAPKLLILLAAAFLISLGAIFCFVAWKLVQLKRRVEQLARSFEAQVIIQKRGTDTADFGKKSDDFTHILESIDVSSKKITFH